MIVLRTLIDKFPEAYVEGIYRHKKYGISKKVFNDGKSVKIYAKELGGNDFISLNFYKTSKGEIIKPCEMPMQKVIRFMQDVEIIKG